MENDSHQINRIENNTAKFAIAVKTKHKKKMNAAQMKLHEKSKRNEAIHNKNERIKPTIDLFGLG